MILTRLSPGDIRDISQLKTLLKKEEEALLGRLVQERDDVRFYQGAATMCQLLLKALNKQ